MIKRRSFLQGIAATVFGGIAALKGFYTPGDRIECECGNRARFVLFAKVNTE